MNLKQHSLAGASLFDGEHVCSRFNLLPETTGNVHRVVLYAMKDMIL